MRLVLDVDGVLADFIRGFMMKANQMYNVPVYGTREQKQWDTFEGLNREQVSAVWDFIKRSEDFWRELPLLANPMEHVRLGALHLKGDHEIYFATSRPGIQSKLQTEVWLGRWFIPRATVIVTSNKGEFARVVGADALIDDKPGNVVFTQYHSPKTTAYIIDRPYNQFDPEVIGSKVIRVKTVTEFLNRVEGK